MSVLTFIAAGIFALIGVLHLGLALYDFSTVPRFFRPADDEVMASLKHTHIEVAGNTRDYWTGTLGIHICHAMGVLLFAGMIVLAESHHMVGMRPLLTLVGGTYSLIAWRFWSKRPISLSLIGTVLLIASWAMG